MGDLSRRKKLNSMMKRLDERWLVEADKTNRLAVRKVLNTFLGSFYGFGDFYEF